MEMIDIFGTLANCGAIIIGSILGAVFQMGIPERLKSNISNAMGLSIVLVGIMMALKTDNILVVIISLTVGGIVGELIEIDDFLIKFGKWVTAHVGNRFGDVGKAMVDASLLFCVGAMAIVGSIQDGLAGDPSVLFAKATLDGIISVVFAASSGIGTALSALPVLLYQGSITIAASQMQDLVNDSMFAAINGTGGLLIFVIGTNMLKITDIKIANYLPSMIFAVILAYVNIFN